MVPGAAVLYACDGAWWHQYHSKTSRFKGQKWTQDANAAAQYGLNHIPGEHKEGLCTEPNKIHFGSNGGFQAINLAYHFGATRIALLALTFNTPGASHIGTVIMKTD